MLLGITVFTPDKDVAIGDVFLLFELGLSAFVATSDPIYVKRMWARYRGIKEECRSMASISAGMAWFKKNFASAVASGIKGTPFSLDMLTAIAVQETFSDGWGAYFSTMITADVLKICVGDSLDAPRRQAFPRNKAELLAAPHGEQIFVVAHDALQSNPAYRGIAVANPQKFAHGYGIFQYDIQFCKGDPNFFLLRQWFDFSQCLDRAIKELKVAMVHAYGSGKTTLTRDEMVYVAIAYNAGHVNINGDFKQGYQDGDGKFYGELIDNYLDMASGIAEA